MLHFEPNVIIFAIVNFVILVSALTFFLYKPVLRMLDERSDKISSALDSAAQARLEAVNTEERLRNQVAEARQNADAILADARLKGEAVREEIVEQARNEAAALTEAARAEIAAEKEKAVAELRGQVADLALLMTERLLREGLTPQQQSLLLDKYAAEMEQLQ